MSDLESTAATPQPPPTGMGDIVLDQVRLDLETRAEFGHEKYGTYLRAHNGRDPLEDAYQEALDLVMYLCQMRMERDDKHQEENPRREQ